MALSRVRLSRRASASASLGALLCVIGCDGENSSSSRGNAVLFCFVSYLMSCFLMEVNHCLETRHTSFEWRCHYSSSARLLVHLFKLLFQGAVFAQSTVHKHFLFDCKIWCFCAAIRFCSAKQAQKNVQRYFHVCILGFGLKAAGSCWGQT